MSRRYSHVRAVVPWSQAAWEFTLGTHEGLHLLRWGWGPRSKLATYRQLRAMGLRPGGQDPVAVVHFRCRHALKKTYAYLYLISDAKPVRPMTPAKRAAIDKALAARRTCRQCGIEAEAELPRAHRTCEPCRYSLGLLDADDQLHEYLVGEPTLSPAELADLPTAADSVTALWTDKAGSNEPAETLEVAA
jgi:hypothetical protein